MKSKVLLKFLGTILAVAVTLLSTNNEVYASTVDDAIAENSIQFITNNEGDKCIVVKHTENVESSFDEVVTNVTYEFYPIEEDSSFISPLAAIGGSEDFTDKNGSFTIRLTLSADKKNVSNVDYLKLTQCVGQTIYIESGAQVSGTSLQLKNVGFRPQGEGWSEEITTYNNVGLNFTKSPGFSNYVLASGNIDGAVSAYYKCSITRGGSTWAFQDAFISLSN